MPSAVPNGKRTSARNPRGSPRNRAHGSRSKSPHARARCRTPKNARTTPSEKRPPIKGMSKPHLPPKGHTTGPPQPCINGENILPKNHHPADSHQPKHAVDHPENRQTVEIAPHAPIRDGCSRGRRASVTQTRR